MIRRAQGTRLPSKYFSHLEIGIEHLLSPISLLGVNEMTVATDTETAIADARALQTTEAIDAVTAM